MVDTTVHQTIRECTVNFPVSDTDECPVAQRKSPAATTALDRVAVEVVERALRATGYSALRGVQIEIERGVVLLWGRVPTYHLKQLAQATAQRVDGVRGIANGIEVVSCR